MTKKYLPLDLSDVDRAFGAKAMDILPPYGSIPDEFKQSGGSNPWVKWQQQWFYRGLDAYPVARDGIDLKKAMNNLACVQGSFSPKHEHKEAGVAYLASLWFSSPDGQPVKPKQPA